MVICGYGWLRSRSYLGCTDEWARQLRGRIGYLAALVGLGVNMSRVFSPAIRSALFTATALPASADLFLDWHAGG